jgi:hypothetical protein
VGELVGVGAGVVEAVPEGIESQPDASLRRPEWLSTLT